MAVTPVSYKVLRPGAYIPTQGTVCSAGWDIRCTERHETVDYIEYYTSLAFAIPEGHCGLLLPRSSISNTSLTLSNSVGLIDSDYRGEIKFRFRRVSGSNTAIYDIGDKVGQLLIIQHPKIVLTEVVDLGYTDRGTGGYGSTGR